MQLRQKLIKNFLGEFTTFNDFSKKEREFTLQSLQEALNLLQEYPDESNSCEILNLVKTSLEKKCPTKEETFCIIEALSLLLRKEVLPRHVNKASGLIP